MEIDLILKGLLIGFSIAAPVGPIGVLCIRRTLAEGRATGFVSGLGAATADAMYGCIAGFGLTFISTLLLSQKLWLQIIGGVFLCYIGVKTFRSRPAENAANAQSQGLVGAYASTFFLTVTNPLTILFFLAMFAGVGGTVAVGNYFAASVLVFGVFLGSAAWWLLLSAAVSIFRSRFDYRTLGWVNRISGIIVTGFGLLALISSMGAG